MLIWKGWGILTVLIIFIVWNVVFAILLVLLHVIGLGAPAEVISFSLALVAAASANWFAGKHLNGKPPRELIDTKTGERVSLTSRHELFYINMEYWSLPVVVFAVLNLGRIFR